MIVLIFCAGCTPMTRREQILFTGMVLAQAADYETTRRYIAAGGTETNPLTGDRPSRDTIALFKIGFVGVLYGLGEIWPEHREGFYSLGIVSGGGAAIWNNNLYERWKH